MTHARYWDVVNRSLTELTFTRKWAWIAQCPEHRPLIQSWCARISYIDQSDVSEAGRQRCNLSLKITLYSYYLTYISLAIAVPPLWCRPTAAAESAWNKYSSRINLGEERTAESMLLLSTVRTVGRSYAEEVTLTNESVDWWPRYHFATVLSVNAITYMFQGGSYLESIRFLYVHVDLVVTSLISKTSLCRNLSFLLEPRNR